MAILKLENVTKRFGGLVAVNDVSLEIENGESIGIVGPNGSGKTTLYNLISGVFPVDEGRILFEGIDITPLPPYKRAPLGIARSDFLKASKNIKFLFCFGPLNTPWVLLGQLSCMLLVL